MEHKQEQFDAMVKDYKNIMAQDMSSDRYLNSLARFCKSIAQHVLAGVKSDFGTPMIDEVTELANKATHPIGHCAVFLQHSVSNGKKFGVTFDFLESIMALPMNVVNLTKILTRKEGESYGNHYNRLIDDHTAVKLMMSELVFRSDITKYCKPTKENHVRCCSLLDRAMVLKNYSAFDHMQQDTLCDTIVDVDTATTLTVSVEEQSANCTKVKYFFDGGVIPIGMAVFTWANGFVTGVLSWDSTILENFKDQRLVFELPYNEFVDFVSIHHTFYEYNPN